MNPTGSRLGGFEERLLTELKEKIRARAAASDAPVEPAPTRRRQRRTRLVAVAGAGALAAGAFLGAPVLLGDAGAPPAQADAFELTSNTDGTITVTIHWFDDADDLEQQLREHGVPAAVEYTEDYLCRGGRGTPARHPYLFHGPQEDNGDLTFTVRPSDYAPDETLVINTAFVGDEAASFVGALHELIVGPVDPCVPADLQIGPPVNDR